jgi:hypothetical protein
VIDTIDYLDGFNYSLALFVAILVVVFTLMFVFESLGYDLK